jgi:glyoxylase-like metal-dependent hydrolase (beta-lactamase superfamily II)
VTVRVVCEGWAPLATADESPGHVVDWAEQFVRYPWSRASDDAWAWHVHAFVVDGPFGTAVIDTGLGTFPPFEPWTQHDERAWEGIEPADVRTVILTHLHADHAGGAVEPGGAPRFPNARYVVHPADWTFFDDADDQRNYAARHAIGGLEDLMDLDPDDREVRPGVRVIHTPGHTPGHRSVVLEDEILVTGDLLHMPIQVAHPDWPSNHDVDPAIATTHRGSVLAAARDRGWTVGVNHFAQPFGRVGPDGWLPLPPELEVE